MSKRIALARRAGGPNLDRPIEAEQTRPLAPDVTDVDAAADVALPRDHPRWLRDRFTVTAATKALVDRLKPMALRMFGFWDHRVHRLTLDEAHIAVDPCGSYRLE